MKNKKRKKKNKKIRYKKKKFNKLIKKNKKVKKIREKKRKRKKKIQKKKIPKIKFKRKIQTSNIIFSILKIQENLGGIFKLKIKLNLDSKIKSLFDLLDKKISNIRTLVTQEKQRLKIEKYEKQRKLELLNKKKQEEQENYQLKLQQQQLKEEKKLEIQRNKDLKKFLRKEQAILRKEQSERQKKFLEEIKLHKQIENFRIREIKEIENLEKISLKEKREDYSELQERIENLKEKYRKIRDQKIRDRVEALGIEITDEDDRDALLKKESQYIAARQKIEFSLESFYRSAASLVFQLNKKHLTREMSIFRCIDRRFETGEIFIKWDETKDDEWLILIYIKDNSFDGEIIIEDKCNKEKNLSHEFKPNEIFKASDLMVDSLTQLLHRLRENEKKN